MKKQISILLLALCVSLTFSYAQKPPKYIFFMIGDGMGFGQIHATELYAAALQKQTGIVPLVFSKFPYASFATSNSLSHGVTDSGAGGTALAVGYKTKNGVIGMDSAGVKSYKSLAYFAKEKGLKVGITTSVSIDHATPASFYANQPNRDMYYEIGQDIIDSDFDFFAGSGFLRPHTNAKKQEVPSLLPQLEKAGYKLLYGLKDYQKVKNRTSKMILMNNQGADNSSIKYAIDQQGDDLTLAEITDAAIETLSQGDNGFFLMVEGGKIDWASHSNDGATVVKEVLSFNESVKKAYDFYLKHPEETLIVVTADHETGGLVVGNGSSTLRVENLLDQKKSQGEVSTLLNDFRNKKPNASWEEVKEFLGQHLGLWKEIEVSKTDEQEIHVAFENSFINHQNETAKSLYATNNKIAALAIAALNKASSIGWTSGGHSAGYIPIYAIGVGAEKFNHKMDNVDIPRTVSKIAGWDLQ